MVKPVFDSQKMASFRLLESLQGVASSAMLANALAALSTRRSQPKAAQPSQPPTRLFPPDRLGRLAANDGDEATAASERPSGKTSESSSSLPPLFASFVRDDLKISDDAEIDLETHDCEVCLDSSSRALVAQLSELPQERNMRGMCRIIMI